MNNISRLELLDVILFILTLVSPFISSTFAFSQNHAFLIAVGIWGIYGCFLPNFKTTTIEKGVGVLAVLLGIYAIIFSYDLIGKHIRFLMLLGYPIFFINCKRLFRTSTDKKVLSILFTLITLVFIESVIAILQYYELVPYRSEFYKIVGTFRSPNFLGVYLSFGCIIATWCLMSSLKKNIKYIIGVTLLCIGIVIILTQSRTAILISISGSLFLFFNSKVIQHKIRSLKSTYEVVLILISSIVLGAGLYYGYHLKKDSADGRLFIAKITLKEIALHPILGHGFFSFTGGYNIAKSHYFTTEKREWKETKIANHVYQAFNDYLYFLYEYGVPLSVLLLGILIGYIKYTLQHKGDFWLLGVSFIGAYLIGIAFLPLSNKTAILSLFFIGLALLESSEKKETLLKFFPFHYLTIAILILFYSLEDITNRIDTEKSFKTLAQNLDAEHLSEVEKNISNVYDFGRLQFNYGLNLWNYDPSKKAIDKMNKGFKISRLPKQGELLANSLIKYGNYKEAEQVLRFNINNEPFRFKPRYNLLQFYKKVYNKKKAITIAKELQELPIKIASEKIVQYRKETPESIEKEMIVHFDIQGGITDNFYLKSENLKRTIPYRLYIPNSRYITEKTPTLYLTDGQQYINNKDFIQKMDNLISQRKIQPIILVCVDPRDIYDYNKNYRNEYFWCNKNYVNFFTQELIPEIEDNFPVSPKKENRTIMGHSFGGLFSAYLGYEAHYLFKNIIMQSPAFHPCSDIYDYYRNSKKLDLKMYMSYGTGKDTETQDLPMIEILQNKGYDLKVNEVKGGNHDWGIWKKQTEEIMIHFFGVSKSSMSN